MALYVALERALRIPRGVAPASEPLPVRVLVANGPGKSDWLVTIEGEEDAVHFSGN